MGFTTTPELGLIKPDTDELIGSNNWESQYNDNLDIIEDLADRAAVAAPGWQYISHPTIPQGASSFTIQIPDECFMIRVHGRLHADAVDEVMMRYNGVSNTVYRTSLVAHDALGNLDVNTSGLLNQTHIDHISTSSVGNMTCTIYRANTNEPVVYSTSTRQSSNATAHRFAVAAGRAVLSGHTRVEELRLAPSFTTFRESDLWVEGWLV
jgi:hypothetical protein